MSKNNIAPPPGYLTVKEYCEKYEGGFSNEAYTRVLSRTKKHEGYSIKVGGSRFIKDEPFTMLERSCGPVPPGYLSVEDYCEKYEGGFSRNVSLAVQRRARDAEVDAVKLGRRWFIKDEPFTRIKRSRSPIAVVAPPGYLTVREYCEKYEGGFSDVAYIRVLWRAKNSEGYSIKAGGRWFIKDEPFTRIKRSREPKLNIIPPPGYLTVREYCEKYEGGYSDGAYNRIILHAKRREECSIKIGGRRFIKDEPYTMIKRIRRPIAVVAPPGYLTVKEYCEKYEGGYNKSTYSRVQSRIPVSTVDTIKIGGRRFIKDEPYNPVPLGYIPIKDYCNKYAGGYDTSTYLRTLELVHISEIDAIKIGGRWYIKEPFTK